MKRKLFLKCYCAFFTFFLTRVLKKMLFLCFIFSFILFFLSRLEHKIYNIKTLIFFFLFCYLFLSYQLYLFSRSLNNLIFFLQFDCAIQWMEKQAVLKGMRWGSLFRVIALYIFSFDGKSRNRCSVLKVIFQA